MDNENMAVEPLDSPYDDLPELDDPTPEGKETPKKAEISKEEGTNYWRDQAIKARMQYAELAEYQGIINALKNSPTLVDTLENAMAGQLADETDMDSTDSRLWEDDDDDTPTFKTEQTVAERQPVIQDEDRGALVEKKRQELNAFFTRLAEQGVPDHAMDEFLEYIKNPSGTSLEDLWAAYDNRRSRLKKVQTEVEVEEAPPPPIATISGETEKPAGDGLKNPVDGQRYVANPNNPYGI